MTFFSLQVKRNSYRVCLFVFFCFLFLFFFFLLFFAFISGNASNWNSRVDPHLPLSF